jgi:hypothetical protein
VNAALRNVLCLTLPGVLLIALTACGGSDGGQSAVPALTTPSASTQSASESGDVWLGHYVGSATITGVQYFADAMTTADGLIRLYVAGPIDADYGGSGGNLPQTVPATSAQLAGTLQGPTNQISGDGLVFGQQCEASDPIQFCADIGHADISVAYSNDTDSLPAIQGNILVTTSAGTETWSLNMSLYGPNYVGMFTAKDIAGIYQEELADFALSGDTLITISDEGALSFQSASSGCTGIGQVRPHLDGAQNMFDVTLTISGCNAQYSHFNGTYDGLATTTTSSEWDYDSNLRMWLSQPDSDVSGALPPALTTWAPWVSQN